MTELAHGELLTARQAGVWKLDPAISSVLFTHKTLWGLMTVKGRFHDISGEGETGPDGGLKGSIHLAVTSLDTGHPKRDAHLRSAEFFDADKHPTIDFTLVSADLESAQIRLEGVLEVRGIREFITVTADVAEADSESVVLTVKTDIDRGPFGMSWNRLAMIRGRAAVSVKAVFHREASHREAGPVR